MKSLNDTKLSQPPRLIEKFLHWSLPEELKEPVLGDLAEEYSELLAIQPMRANYWYTRQALRTSLQFLTQTRRGVIMFLLSVVVFIGFVVMTMIQGGDLSMFANFPSLLVVIPPAIFVTLAATSKQARSNAWSLLFSEAIELDTSKLKAAKHVFTILGNMSMLMGYIGVVINAVAMASNIEPELFGQHFGPAFAVFMLTLFYALLIKALCYAAEAKIQSKIFEQED